MNITSVKYHKPNAAISICGNYIRAVNLAKNKKGHVFAESELPPSVVVNGSLMNKAELTKYILKLIKETGITGKEVNISLPEDKIFTKLLLLPKINYKDLQESIRWQEDKILPEPQDRMYYDWRLVEDYGSGIEVLFVAIPRDILDPYLEAFQDAGITPVIIEPASVSLCRLTAPEKTGGTLIIEAAKNYAVIVLLHYNGGLVTTSLVYCDQSDRTGEIAQTAHQLAEFYEEKYAGRGLKIIKTVISGADTEELRKAVGEKTGTVSQPPKPSFERGAAIKESYLAVYYLGKCGFTLPNDPDSINLLPPDLIYHYENKIKTAFFKERLNAVILLLLLLNLLSLVSLGHLFIWNRGFLRLLKNPETQTSAGIFAVQKQQVELLNAQADEIASLSRLKINFKEKAAIAEIAAQAGAVVDSYAWDDQKNVLEISGKIADRASLLSLRDKLEKHSGVKSVSLPLTTFERETKIPFVFNIEINNENQ